jgi:hypothetical protein
VAEAQAGIAVVVVVAEEIVIAARANHATKIPF